VKILVIRFSSIGDIVLTSPVLRCLKKQLDCEIHFLVKEAFRELVEHSPYVDKVFTLKEDLKDNLKLLKSESYSYIVDLHKNIRSSRVRSYLRVKGSGFSKLNFKKWLYVNTGLNLLPDLHLVDRYFESVKSLGVKNDHEGMDFFIPKGIHTDRFKLPDEYYALAIGGSYFTKKIPPDKLVELISILRQRVCILGGSEDVDVAEFLEGQCGDAILNLVGKTTIMESALIIQNSTALLSPDTGMMHIGAALKKPVICIWGNTIPSFGMYPYYGKHIVPNLNIEVQGLNCRPCSKLGHAKCPKGHFRCMTEQRFDKLGSWLEQMQD
jgi:ADP-heptose:LPS heptosyltransferase